VVVSTWVLPKQWTKAQIWLRHWFEQRAARYGAKLQAQDAFLTSLVWILGLGLLILFLSTRRTQRNPLAANRQPITVGVVGKAQGMFAGLKLGLLGSYLIFELRYLKMYWSHGQRLSSAAVKKLSVEDSLRNSIGMVASRLREIITFFLG
jgi:hypothetical protein